MARPVTEDAGRALARAFTAPDWRPLYALADALEAEVEALARPAARHEVSHVKLRWWHEEAARLGDGSPRHPLTRGLAGLGLEGATVAPVLQAALAVSERRLAGHVPATLPDLEQDLAATVALGGRLAALDRPLDVQARAAALSVAIGLVTVATTVQPAAAMGDLRLPLGPLDAAGVAPDDLAAEPLPDSVQPLVRELLARGVALAGAAAPLPAEDGRRLRTVTVEAALAARRARRLLRSATLSEAAPSRLGLLNDLVCAWRVAARAH